MKETKDLELSEQPKSFFINILSNYIKPKIVTVFCKGKDYQISKVKFEESERFYLQLSKHFINNSGNISNIQNLYNQLNLR